jgi:predicted ATPase
MKIYSFSIEGFANIEHVRLEMEDMSALVAPNGYGKSNILHSIDFGIGFLTADEATCKQMMDNRWQPINVSTKGKDFAFAIEGTIDIDGNEYLFVYGYCIAWAKDGEDGRVLTETLKVKRPSDQRFRQLLNRQQAEECLIVPSATGRCNKLFNVSSVSLALPSIANATNMYLTPLATQICAIRIPNLETLDNPESYFSVGGGRGISMLGGMTLSEYIYQLKASDEDHYTLLKDGLMQLIPDIILFTPEVIVLPDGQRRIYDITIQEKFCAQPTSILQLSSGSKRIIFLLTLCIAARKQSIPMIMMEEPENSVHPRMMENLLLTLRSYALDTKILLTSHSPYLMRYLLPAQMYFGLPKNDGVAHFARINPSKLRYLYKYAGDMELTIGEFMFDYMLDIEGDYEKIEQFFSQQ